MAHVRSGIEFERRVYDVEGETAVRCVVFDEKSRYVENSSTHILSLSLSLHCACMKSVAMLEYACQPFRFNRINECC